MAFLWIASASAVVYKLTRRADGQSVEPLPTIAWATATEHSLQTADGEALGAWLFAGQADLPIVILLHGNGGSRRNALPYAELLAAEGYPSLAISLRCHGDSTGDVNDFGRSAAADVIAAVEFVERKFPGRRIVIRGTSLGAAAAIFAVGRLGERVSGYILECPYRDLHTAVRNRTSIFLPPVLDTIAYHGLALVAPLFVADPYSIAPILAIGGIPKNVPVLFFAGAKDRYATLAEVQALHAAIPEQSELVVLGDAAHGRLLFSSPQEYSESLLEFLRHLHAH